MEVQKTEKQVLQWHPAFYAGIQIELEQEAGNLIFENEHQLGTKPKEIDVLVIKKETGIAIRTNIGRIFRKHNIVEYKSPTDYLSVDDFYRVYGYACFYKADTKKADSIRIADVTLTFVCHKYPKKLIRHWEKERHYIVKKEDDGIYYILGDKIPIQLILTSQLSEERNFWLRNLTNNIKGLEKAQRIIVQYEQHKNSGLYQSVMDMIVRANRETFEEVKSMCKALEELMKDELDACRNFGFKQGIEQGIERGIEQGMEQGMVRGIKSLIETCQELGLSKEETLIRVKNKFSLEEENAVESLEKYWKTEETA